MKYLLNIGGRNALLTDAQLAAIVDAVDGVEFLTEKYVGSGAGTQGHGNNYIALIEAKAPHEWLHAAPITDHYIETIKLTMKLHPTP